MELHMQTQTWTITSIKSHQAELKQRIQEHIPLKDSPFKEAYARALGLGTNAALVAALKSTPELSARDFCISDFIARIAELCDDTTAEVVTEILEGVELNVQVIKLTEQGQDAGRFSDVVYDVQVSLDAIPGAAFDGDILFHLPEFGQEAGVEPYRVDSASDRRAAADYRKTRFGAGAAAIVAKLVDGRWRGGFYVYAAKHQADDTQCIKSLKAALARAILPKLPTRVRCSIFRPDNYQLGAWRVEIRLPPGVRHFWNGSPFQFDVPSLPKRIFHMESQFKADTDIGRFADGVWKADLYSNGIDEANNPTGLDVVKHTLLQRVNQAILRGGYGAPGELIPVTDDSGKMVGTVQLRDGGYEAWNRTRALGRPGNSHKLLGHFLSVEESTAAIRASL
jgi:hypothetical protein